MQGLVREDGEESQLRCAIEVLEQEKRMMEEVPAMQLDEKTKRLRQACFKANYKKKRFMGRMPVDGPRTGATHANIESDMLYY